MDCLENRAMPIKIKAVGRWEDALVLSSRRTEGSPDGNRYQLRRIVRHTAMRFPILVGGKIRASSATGLKELGVEAVLEKPRITLYNIEGTLIASNETWVARSGRLLIYRAKWVLSISSWGRMIQRWLQYYHQVSIHVFWIQ